MRNATISRLRHEIDAGRTRDKVAFPDPATAPLGTDDEAGGTPDRAAQVAQALSGEWDMGEAGSSRGVGPVSAFVAIGLAIAGATLAGILAVG
jgi:hypothetical protein